MSSSAAAATTTESTTTSRTFRLDAASDAKTVEIQGTFGSDESTHWTPIAMTKSAEDGKYEVTIDGLVPGTQYLYKFKVDGEWALDPEAETAKDDADIVNNVFTVPSPSSAVVVTSSATKDTSSAAPA
ncbi:hypothetical protein LPJ57_003806, partial [Coemansia sp. RSA 486]